VISHPAARRPAPGAGHAGRREQRVIRMRYGLDDGSRAAGPDRPHLRAVPRAGPPDRAWVWPSCGWATGPTGCAPTPAATPPGHPTRHPAPPTHSRPDRPGGCRHSPPLSEAAGSGGRGARIRVPFSGAEFHHVDVLPSARTTPSTGSSTSAASPRCGSMARISSGSSPPPHRPGQGRVTDIQHLLRRRTWPSEGHHRRPGSEPNDASWPPTAAQRLCLAGGICRCARTPAPRS